MSPPVNHVPNIHINKNWRDKNLNNLFPIKVNVGS